MPPKAKKSTDKPKPPKQTRPTGLPPRQAPPKQTKRIPPKGGK